MNGRILTCVYCGHEYPQDTPAAANMRLVEICDEALRGEVKP